MSPVYRSKLLIALILIVLLGGIIFLSDRFLGPKSATVSGTIDYNGTLPEGATLAVAAKQMGQGEYETVVTGLSPFPQTEWSWTGAKSGAAYELQAYLQMNGRNLASSQTLAVAAPADGEVLVINSTHQPSDEDAVISGTVNMNGAIPEGSTIAIGTKLPDETQYNIVVTDLQATDGVQWSWNEAKEGTLYDLKAFLQTEGGVNLYESERERVAAPASDEVLTLNARSASPTPTPAGPTPTPQPTTIEGTINMNGPAPSNSAIIIAARVHGGQQFNTVVTNIGTSNGSGWAWTSANSGVTYDIQAWVQVNNSTVLQSQILTVTAPAANEVLTINNASAQYPAPAANSITNSCLNLSNNLWQVAFTYNSRSVVQNAQQYSFTVGTNSGGNQLVNTTVTPNNPNQSQNYTSGYVFTPNQTYYAQYAYSPCQGCNIWSAFSQPLQFYCSGQPTATPMPTNTPTPTLSPTPTLPPMTSSCNQTCGSNGYSCATGLQCTSGGTPGSQVCRNPNCTLQPDCTCRLLDN